MKRLATVLLLLATVGTHGAEVGRTSAALGNATTTATSRNAIPAAMKTYDVGCGTFQAPEDFEFKHTGTKDSFMGTLTRKSDGFTIHFDHCFGIRVSVPNKGKFAFFRVHTVGNNAAYTGIERANGKQTVATTICDWCERGRRFVEESAAIRLLPAEQREEKYRELNERRTPFDKEHPFPANFSADFTRDEDLLDFMLIVNSYTQKNQQ
jgi:hypothetical protein